MIAAWLLAAVLAAAAPADDDIVVVARQIEQVALALGRDGEGRTTCGLDRSSGNVRIDRAICKRAARCIVRGPIVPAKVDACVSAQKRKLTADWARGVRS